MRPAPIRLNGPPSRAARRLHQTRATAAEFDVPHVSPPRDQLFSWAPTSAAKSDGGRFAPCAEREADKSGNPDRLGGRLRGGVDDLADAGFAIDYKDLVEQHDLFIEFAQAAFDHALDDRLGLAAALRLLAQHGALAVERRCRYGCAVEIERIGRRGNQRPPAAAGV